MAAMSLIPPAAYLLLALVAHCDSERGLEKGEGESASARMTCRASNSASLNYDAHCEKLSRGGAWAQDLWYGMH